MTANPSLGERMKGYEADTRLVLPEKTIAAVRVDGRTFHTWTRGLERPYDPHVMRAMSQAAKALCADVSGPLVGYTQSDEINVLFTDLGSRHAEPWFGGVVQKIASVAASVVTGAFAREFPPTDYVAPALFDARVFTLPSREEAANYLVWRQRDCQKNAVSMLAGEHFSHRELHGKNTAERRTLLLEAGADPDLEDPRFLGGQVVYRDTVFEKVRYTDKRTGEEHVTPEPVERGVWVSDAAPEFAATPGNWLFERLPAQVTPVTI